MQTGPVLDLTGEHTSNEYAQMRTKMAARRTMMEADRTLMAWVRIGLSMISFGFTIFKILEGLQTSGVPAAAGFTPRTIGLYLTGIGTASIIMGTAEFVTRFREARQVADISLLRPSLVIAVFIALTGAILFAAIVFYAA